MILIPEVLTLLILNILFAIFATFIVFEALKITLYWDQNSYSHLQYNLEKRSYLSATIIKFIFSIKIPLFLFFIFTLDKLSNLLPGAMCGAGVVDATIYGNYLLILKIINIYLFAYWLALNAQDLKEPHQPYTKYKFALFLPLYLFFIAEIVLEFVMFDAIDIQKVVSCCGDIYSSSANSYFSTVLALSHPLLLSLFYGNYLLIALFFILKRGYLFALSNIIFLIISLVSLISFFGTYIYELPSHHCPFCLLQSDYHYIGYLLYTFLFIGTFWALKAGFIKQDPKTIQTDYTISFGFITLYLLAISLYPIIYYIKNGVFL
jgi:hypothetical protein